MADHGDQSNKRPRLDNEDDVRLCMGVVAVVQEQRQAMIAMETEKETLALQRVTKEAASLEDVSKMKIVEWETAKMTLAALEQQHALLPNSMELQRLAMEAEKLALARVELSVKLENMRSANLELERSNLEMQERLAGSQHARTPLRSMDNGGGLARKAFGDLLPGQSAMASMSMGSLAGTSMFASSGEQGNRLAGLNRRNTTSAASTLGTPHLSGSAADFNQAFASSSSDAYTPSTPGQSTSNMMEMLAADYSGTFVQGPGSR
ncbi:hypothetical protein GGF50DRAFT_114259 [Schizophyllum commune]